MLGSVTSVRSAAGVGPIRVGSPVVRVLLAVRRPPHGVPLYTGAIESSTPCPSRDSSDVAATAMRRAGGGGVERGLGCGLLLVCGVDGVDGVGTRAE